MLDILSLININLSQVIQYGIPVGSLILTWKNYKANDKKIKKDNEQRQIDEVKKVFPVVANYHYKVNSVEIYNRTGYPIFDIFISQGIDVNSFYERTIKTVYIRTILPMTCVKVEVKNHGLGMNSFLIVKMFFRDYLGNEWFRDSYGRFLKFQKYKEFLQKEQVIDPPYSEVQYSVRTLD